MCPDKQRGIGLIAAIFLIVVVASLAVGVTSLIRSGNASFELDVYSYKAFLAADSGAQLALNRVFAPVGAGVCAARTFVLDQVGLEGCSATTSCVAANVSGELHYNIESRGRCGVGNTLAERVVEVRAHP